jgi:6-phosphogluconolactonase (cycloisomerase 2 family)
LTPAETELSVGPHTEVDTSLAVTPSGKYLLVTYLAGSDLRVYATGASGALTAVDPSPFTVASPSDVTIDHSGTHVFVCDYAQKAIYSLRLDSQTGSVTQDDGVIAWRDPRSIAVGHGSQPLVSTSRYALVTNQDGDTVSSYGIDASDGSLVAGSTTSTAASPVGVGLSLDGSLAFVSSETGNSAASYDADPLTGDLVATGSTVATGTQPLVVAVDPSGRFVFTSNFAANSISRLSVSSSGVLAALGNTSVGTAPLGLAMHPTGAYLFVAERGQNRLSMYGVASATGALGKGGCCSTGFTGTEPTWVTVTESGGSVYVTDFGSDEVTGFGLDTLNNGLTSIGTFATGAGPFGVVVDPQEKYLYVANSAADSVSRFSIAANGTLTNLGTPTATGGTQPMTLAMDGSGERLYVLNEGSDDITVFSIDRATGDLTALGNRIATGDRPGTIVVHVSLE